MASRKLLLFDIDGTLLDTGGAGLSALLTAMREAFGVSGDFPEVELAGATDSGIVRNLFSHFDIPEEPETTEQFYVAYLNALRGNLAAPGSPGKLLPGVERLLEAIEAETNHVTGLLTGNIRRGAYIKVAHYGIDRHFPFGAFGDDHHDRNELGRFALRRAMEHLSESFKPDEIVVIGDTPKDVRCAKAIAARSVAVATGSFSADELRGHDPHHVLEHFEETEAVLKAIG